MVELFGFHDIYPEDSHELVCIYSATKESSTMGAVGPACFAISRQPTPVSAIPVSEPTKSMYTSLKKARRTLIFSSSTARNIQDAVRCQFVPKFIKSRTEHSVSTITGRGTTPKSLWKYMLATKSRSFQ